MRVGNGASDQLQLDIYGEAMDSLYRGSQRGLTIGHQGWNDVRTIVDWLCEHWDQAEEGIWETRGGRKDFTYGRVMSWVAMDRAVRLAGQLGPAGRRRERGPRSATGSTSRSWNAGGARSEAPSCSTTAPTCSTRRTC